MTTAEPRPSLDFVRTAIEDDLKQGRFPGVVTRFPPEPNGYLHVGHAKSICLNFTLAAQYGGKCHLRFDDTNPTREEQRYIDAIKEDIRWLGFNWDGNEFYASDYFEQLYAWAVQLIDAGLAYVDDLSLEEIRQHRGTLTTPGRPSPHRDRPVEENLDLFRKMRDGAYENGARVLRAKIDMASPNINLRDPVMYRILKAKHHRTGETWSIYPMYDWAHGQSDALEGITHSVCTLEFEDHRPLYDWFIRALAIHHPRQIEFARLNLSHTVMSKRKLLELVNENHVAGWDDPRMPTISAMRRRGYPPEAIRAFAEGVGVTKRQQTVSIALLEHHVREHLNKSSPRVMGVIKPLKVVIENYPEDQTDELDAVNNPEDESAGTRQVPFGREIYIEQDDFMEDPPRKFFRLAPGREVRLRYAYLVTCTDVVKDASGNITELRCTYDPESRGGNAPDGRKVKATLHWVSAKHGLGAEVREYNALFTREDPGDVPEDGDWRESINPESLNVVRQAIIEPSVRGAAPGTQYQFERIGYFCVDPDTTGDTLIFNRTVTLRDAWANIKKREGNA